MGDDKAFCSWKYVGAYIIVPKELFRNPQFSNLSAEAKLLYGFLLDRTSLSATQKDKWKTENGDFYVVYTIKEIMERMSCGHDKASRLLKELETLKLISRTRKNRSQAYRIVVYPVVMDEEKQNSKVPENLSSEVGKSAHNDPEASYPEKDPDVIKHQVRLRWKQEIQDQIAYDVLLDRLPKPYIDSIVEVMVDTLCSSRTKMHISGKLLTRDEVHSRMRGMTDMDICYVYDCLQREKQDIQYLPGYILARLLDAECIKDVAYDRWVRQDSKNTK